MNHNSKNQGLPQPAIVGFVPMRAFSLAKLDDSVNEDCWHQSGAGHVVAISDGASISFDSKRWAEILVRRFSENQDISRSWLRDSIAEYEAVYDRETMPWIKQASFDRGSFASLLGIIFLSAGEGARVFSIGDSMLALVDSFDIVLTIPYINSDEFDLAPDLLSTNPLENGWIDSDVLSNSWRDLNIGSHEAPTVLLMTDALGLWLLEQPQPERVSILLKLRDEVDFREFVLRERAAGRLKRDDTTLIVIGVDRGLPIDH